MSLRTTTRSNWRYVCDGFRLMRGRWRRLRRRWDIRMCERMHCSIGISCGTSRLQPLLHRRRREQVLAGVGKSELDGAFDCAAGVARCTVGAAGCWRRSYQAHDVKETFWFEGLGHADDGAELVAGGVVGGLGGFRQQNHGHALQAIV